VEIVYLVPGYLSSHLYTDVQHREQLWIDYLQLGLGRVGKMRLAPNGVDPGPPDGVQLYVGHPLTDYWLRPAQILQEDLGEGFQVRMYGWDWRRELGGQGEALANQVRADLAVGQRCTLIAHSTGAIIARVAFASLQATGHGEAVRRIVSLGGPHHGTYLAVLALSGLSAEALDLASISSAGRGIQVVLPDVLPAYKEWLLRDIERLIASWPSIYQLMPSLTSEDAAADPLRAELYSAENWPAAAGVSQLWLDYARTTWASRLSSPAAHPPKWVMTTVAGLGHGGGYVLSDVSQLGRRGALVDRTDGDGIVSADSAYLSGGTHYLLTDCRHHELPLVTALTGDLAEWVRAQRSPATPVPPPVRLGVVAPDLIGAPLIPCEDSVKFLPSLCEQGRCGC